MVHELLEVVQVEGAQLIEPPQSLQRELMIEFWLEGVLREGHLVFWGFHRFGQSKIFTVLVVDLHHLNGS